MLSAVIKIWCAASLINRVFRLIIRQIAQKGACRLSRWNTLFARAQKGRFRLYRQHAPAILVTGGITTCGDSPLIICGAGCCVAVGSQEAYLLALVKRSGVYATPEC